MARTRLAARMIQHSRMAMKVTSLEKEEALVEAEIDLTARTPSHIRFTESEQSQLVEHQVASRSIRNFESRSIQRTAMSDMEEDNQACVYASEIPHMTRGMRHLDLAELLIKEKVDKEIKLLKVASADNTSDLSTKRLALPLFNKLSSRIIDKTLRVNL